MHVLRTTVVRSFKKQKKKFFLNQMMKRRKVIQTAIQMIQKAIQTIQTAIQTSRFSIEMTILFKLHARLLGLSIQTLEGCKLRANNRGEDASSSRSRHHSALDDSSEQRATRGVRSVIVGEAAGERRQALVAEAIL